MLPLAIQLDELYVRVPRQGEDDFYKKGMERSGKMTIKLSCMVAAMGAICLSGVAVAETSKYEVGAGLAHFMFEDDALEDDLGFRLYGGTRIGDHWGLELVYDKVGTEIKDAKLDADLAQYYLSALYHFSVEKNVQPYLSLGWGQGETEVGNFTGESTATNIGLGIKWYLAENWILRPSVNRFFNTEGDDDHTTLGLTLAYAWGGGGAVKPAKPSAPLDSDKDGVKDSVDRCPNTAAGLTVDSTGCEVDSDGDGVVDSADNCPNTAARLKVDSKGCPVTLAETVSIDLKVNFDSNSDVVKPTYFNEISRVADFLAQYEGTQVVIEGHTDSSGSAAYNKALSKRRADSVANVLVTQFNIAPSRVTSIGYGEEQPIADESTREGRLANRRVVAKVSTTVKSMQQR